MRPICLFQSRACFNAICLRADAELLSRDYREVPVPFSSRRPDELRLYTCIERVSGAGSGGTVRILNDRISDKRWRADDQYSVRVGWVTVEVIDLALTLPLSQSLKDKLKEYIDPSQDM